MKKRIILIVLMLFMLTGCTYINKVDYNEIITGVVTSNYDLINEYRTGYKYYLPNGVTSSNTSDFNEILQDNNYNYYLYVDVVSYYNRVVEEYEIDNNVYISNKINFADKYGYIEVNQKQNNKYFIEIMYNYAKIEVIVDESYLNRAITNSIIILSSITYNNDILTNIVGDNVLEFSEEEFNIFRARKDSSNFLDVDETEVEPQEEDIIDPDLVD